MSFSASSPVSDESSRPCSQRDISTTVFQTPNGIRRRTSRVFRSEDSTHQALAGPSYQQPHGCGHFLATGWDPLPQIQSSVAGGEPSELCPPDFPPHQPKNVFHPAPVDGPYPPPQLHHRIDRGNHQAPYPHVPATQQPHVPIPLPATGSYLPPQGAYRTFEAGSHAPCPPVPCSPRTTAPNPLLMTIPKQPSRPLQKNPLRVKDSRGKRSKHPRARDATSSAADPILPDTKTPPTVSKGPDHAASSTADPTTQTQPAPTAVQEPDDALFSAASLRYCSMPYSPDPLSPEPLFPTRHGILTPSSSHPLRWYEWVNTLPQPHLFRKELARTAWLNIDVARKGTSRDAEECRVTVTLMVEALGPTDREVVDRLAGVLRAQGRGDVRVEVGLYWYSVVDAFPGEYMRGLERLMVGGLTRFLGR
ncbi:hypothetical protein MMC34_007580 [Xylographa carneopallida]|nr:hypothetical protein [Xylographa carneopallida]